MPRTTNRLSERLSSRRRRRTAFATAAAAVAAPLAAGIALAASAPPAPTITSAPASLTNSTKASFTYSDSAAGARYECEVDGAAFASCPTTGTTYPGPFADGIHNFRVRVVAGGKTSSATGTTWAVDTTPPSTSISFPAAGGTFSPSEWAAGCKATGGICGGSSDANGVSAVLVSIRSGNGNWWSGSGFTSATERFNAATLVAPGSNNTAWTYAMPAPPDGSYTIHVRASDKAGNVTATSAQLSETFSMNSVPPPVPSITSKPQYTTTETTAKFEFTDSQNGVVYLCRLDAAKFASCASPVTYSNLSRATHTFYVEARDAHGNTSAPASYSWTVVKAEGAGVPFTIAGNVGSLSPGVSQTLALTLTNPNPSAITVTALNVAVQAGSSKAGCDGPSNLQVTQSNVSSENGVVVPAKGSVTLPAGAVTAPRVAMLNLSTNQDACKAATFTFSYSGSAHS